MYDFRKIEEGVLNFWKNNKIFQKSLEETRGKKRFVFFEGPPTANGLPHIGHFLTRVYKDLYGRYKTMRGYFVLRKAGWDTHGLPVEIEVEKQLGFTNKKQIEEYGIAKFNKKARESVWKYKKQWEEMTEKMGFWIDLDQPYVTYENSYIESVWSILKEIWNKKLLFTAHKVVPFCTRCGTTLSAHEVAQGYEKITEPSVFIKFKVQSSDPEWKNTSILSWTTTPWTLPGNVALAVNPEHTFVCVPDPQEKDHWLVLEKESFKRLVQTGVLQQEIKESDSFSARELIGISYAPLFNVKELQSPQSYKVYEADFVSTEEGTGVVHTAVMYGEDDYVLGTKVGLPKFHTVDETGKFQNVSEELDERYVKDKETDKLIINNLKLKNLLFKVEDFEHDYPFCWRCKTPLLYYAKQSWFIKTSALKDQLLANNNTVNWVPNHIKEGRFGQWLKEGKDWNLSRERYWGTPLPIWECDQCNHKTTIGSIKELEKLSIGSKNTYYAMRHGYSTRNEGTDMINNFTLEKDNYSLTEEGKKDVEASLSHLRALEDIDLIYSSPFKRTFESAQIAGRIFHKEVRVDERLSEDRHGLACEGKSMKACPLYGQPRNFETKEEGGESLNDVRERLWSFFKEVESECKGKKILIVSHGDPIWLMGTITEGLNEKEVIARSQSDADWYPNFSEFKRVDFRKIPRNELGELDLHRPFIDDAALKCPQCKAKMKKIPDLIDVWFDSGSMPYAQWHWPFENKGIFRQQFPADFITEGIDQTRGWFWSLLGISTLLGLGSSYKNVMVVGHTLDEKGKKMSKSIGNVILPFEMMDKYGVDATRWYFYATTAPGENKIVLPKEIESKLKNFIFTVQNCLRFYELYKNSLPSTVYRLSPKNLLDKWLISKLHRLIRDSSENLDRYEIPATARAIETFLIEDLSNWWLRRSRKRKEALPLLHHVLTESAKLLAPFTPFLAEHIHHQLNEEDESVHLKPWPKLTKKYINNDLETEMDEVKSVVSAGLAIRKEQQIKVRQPLAVVRLNRAKKFNRQLEDLIRDELNVKKIVYDKSQSEPVALDLELTEALISEGQAREVMRQIQEMRKEAKYRLDDKVQAHWHSDNIQLTTTLNRWTEVIKEETLLSEFVNRPHDNIAYDVERDVEVGPGRKIWVGIWKRRAL